MLETITIDGVVLKPGQYFTVPASGWVPREIRRITRGPVAHAVVYVGMQPSGFDCVQAEPGGVGPTRVDHWTGGEVYPMRRSITDRQSTVSQQFVLSTLGAPYSYVSDAFIGIREALHLPHWHWWFRLWSRLKHYECAQLADLALLRADFHNFADGRLPGEVSPVDLWRLDYS